MWYQDYQHGEGTMYYHNGDLYVGHWVMISVKAKVHILGQTVPNIPVTGK